MNRNLILVLPALAAVVLAAGCQRAVSSGPQTVKVAVTDAGFVPAQLSVQSGRPVVLLVTRTTDATCAKEIVIPDEHIRHALPLNREVRLTFTPEKKGDIRYVCGMDMVAGSIKVQ
jgi:plastocyanin domain-containing protein